MLTRKHCSVKREHKKTSSVDFKCNCITESKRMMKRMRIFVCCDRTRGYCARTCYERHFMTCALHSYIRAHHFSHSPRIQTMLDLSSPPTSNLYPHLPTTYTSKCLGIHVRKPFLQTLVKPIKHTKKQVCALLFSQRFEGNWL